MFSFVDLRLALLLSAAVLLVRAQGEDDRKFHHFTGPSQPFFLNWLLKVDFLYMGGRLLRSRQRRKEKYNIER